MTARPAIRACHLEVASTRGPGFWRHSWPNLQQFPRRRTQGVRARKLAKARQILETHVERATRVLVYSGSGIVREAAEPALCEQAAGETSTRISAPLAAPSPGGGPMAQLALTEAMQTALHGEPTAVHLAVAALDRADKLELAITETMDGLHVRAGVSQDRVLALHGSLTDWRCESCGAPMTLAEWLDMLRRRCLPPRCGCGGLVRCSADRPADAPQRDELERAGRAAARADLVIVLGSSLSTYPGAAIPLLAASKGAPYLIVNQGPTDHDGHPAVALRADCDPLAIFPQAIHRAFT